MHGVSRATGGAENGFPAFCLIESQTPKKEDLMAFYIKKTYVDTVPGIELVNIHYTSTPLGQTPKWQAHHETRMMPRGGTLIRGIGGTTPDEAGSAMRKAS